MSICTHIKDIADLATIQLGVVDLTLALPEKTLLEFDRAAGEECGDASVFRTAAGRMYYGVKLVEKAENALLR